MILMSLATDAVMQRQNSRPNASMDRLDRKFRVENVYLRWTRTAVIPNLTHCVHQNGAGMRWSCPVFPPETPVEAFQDSIAIILRDGGTSCSSHTSRYIIYGGWRRDTTYTSVDGQPPTGLVGRPMMANEIII